MMIRFANCIRLTSLAGIFLLACGCATRQPSAPAASQPPMMLVPAGLAGVEDHRASFRQFFCAIDEELAGVMPEYIACDEALKRFGGERQTVAELSLASRVPARSHIGIVRGLGWECWHSLFDPDLLPARHLERRGYVVTEIQVDGLSSSVGNASQIRSAVLAMADGNTGRKLILIGHSKGAVDILEAVTAYPDVAERVAAVISIAGSIGGSPLAEETVGDALAVIPKVPGAQCDVGDGRALQSLKPHVRQQWLASHPLPRDVRYYALVTAPEPDQVSAAMRPGQRRLSQIDPRNDGALLPYDQLIPGGVLLGYVNADHWAVALPIAGSVQLLGSTIVNRNEFPREALWEAAVRYVEWDLARRAP
mgnify:FL=1